MSLSKQLLILIFALLVMITSMNFVLSVNNIKNYLEGESQNHAQDTATSLGLSLSPYMKDTNDSLIKTMASAIFDMGYYSQIRLTSASDQELVLLSNDKHVEGVPAWFIDYFPMKPSVAQSEISSGWTITGVVYVTVNNAYGYRKLYQQAKSSFYSSLLALLISTLLLVVVLRITLASLKRIDLLALDIAEGHFRQIKRLPWTSEIRNVAVSMNLMSAKLKITIDALRDKLAVMGGTLLRDDLTGLHKKSVLETDIMHLQIDESDVFILLIKVDGLSELVKDHGRDAIDCLLKAVSKLLESVQMSHPEVQAKPYRIYGGEFVLLIDKVELHELDRIANHLSKGLGEIGKNYAQSDLGHIGVTLVNPVSTLESNLQAANEAYEQARLIGANGYYLRTDTNVARDISAWKALVFSSIDHASYELTYCGQVHNFQSSQLMLEEAFTHVLDQDGQPVAIGPFVSIAEKFAKIIDFDKGVISKVLDEIARNSIPHRVVVNVSTRSIKNTEFQHWLQKLFRTNSLTSTHLVFGFSAYAVAKDLNAYLDFIQTVHQFKGQVMIKRFETQSMSPDLTKQLKPDFIRLSREIGNGVSQSRQKYDFVQTIQQITTLMDIAVLAENVERDEDYEALRTIGIVGASR